MKSTHKLTLAACTLLPLTSLSGLAQAANSPAWSIKRWLASI